MKQRHTLLATTGASPQVVTETLFAIHHDRQHTWPDDIFLITTSFGKTKAVQGLLHDGHLKRLCQELQRPVPFFTPEHILVVPNAEGEPVEDARSLADHEALADFIMTEVRNRTARPYTSLHASLAGGRKTMTFYIGYAMSLFGRVQDSLSHVLVSEGYENSRDFWFPTQLEAHRHVQGVNGQMLDAHAATVTLAPIPFIRHRNTLPAVLLQSSAHNSASARGGESANSVRFAELVQLINLGENPEGLTLVVDLRSRVIRLESSNPELRLELSPSPIDLAFYALMARASIARENDITRPKKADTSLTKLMLDELMPLCGLPSSDNWKSDLASLTDWNVTKAWFKGASLTALANGVTQSWFDTRKNTLGDQFAQRLPAGLCQWLVPSIIWSESGQRLDLRQQETTPKGGGYGLPLPAGQICIVDPA